MGPEFDDFWRVEKLQTYEAKSPSTTAHNPPMANNINGPNPLPCAWPARDVTSQNPAKPQKKERNGEKKKY